MFSTKLPKKMFSSFKRQQNEKSYRKNEIIFFSPRRFHIESELLYIEKKKGKRKKEKWEMYPNDGCCWILSSMLMRRIGRIRYENLSQVRSCSGKNFSGDANKRDLFRQLL